MLTTVHELKMTLPLRKEKSVTVCGELYIQLDDLHISVSDSTLTTNGGGTDTTVPQSISNHVTTSPSASSVRTANVEASENRDTNNDITLSNQLSLLAVETPTNRRGQGSSRGGASTGSSQQPSPSTSPTPTTTNERGGVGGTATAVGAASVGATSVRGGGGGGEATSPTPPSLASRPRQSVRSTQSQPGTSVALSPQ